MAEDRKANLSYLDADDIDDDRVDFDGMDVLDTAGQKLGDVDGFIVQPQTKRPYYVVVDSGGWFSSRSFLVPIGHARLDTANEALRVDLDRSTIQRFPEFDEDRFPQMSEEQARWFNERTLSECCATELGARTGQDRYDFDKWSHYAQPDWWRSEWVTSLGARRSVTDAGTVPGATTYDVPSASAERPAGERVTAYDRATTDDDIDIERTGERERAGERERLRGEERIPDREILDRAEPGDVIGIEHDGETTSLGDTARDERERLEDEDEAARKELEDDRKNRR